MMQRLLKLLTVFYATTMPFWTLFPFECNCYTFGPGSGSICTPNSFKRYGPIFCTRSQSNDSALIVDLQRRSFETIPPMFLERHDTIMLNLGENRLTKLPDGLKKLRNLQYLNLMGNEIVDISHARVINELPNLEFLVLSNNPLKRLNDLRAFSLIILEAGQCEISEIDDLVLTSLPSLETLNLTGNPLRSLHRLVSRNLTELLLADCQLTDVPPDTFEGLPNLKNLNLGDNKLKTLPDTIFHHNNNLHHLNLRNNSLHEIKNTWFEKLQYLRNLDFSINEITFVNEDNFAKLSSLTELQLGGNRIAVLPNLVTRARNVNLSTNLIGNHIFWNLTNMVKVRKLDLSRNRLYGDCDEFSSMSLRILDLGYNNMTRVKRNSFAGVPNLTDLSLRGNQFSHGADVDFEGNKILVDLELEDNPWHCNCSEIFALFSYLERGRKADTSSLTCSSPGHVRGESWTNVCAREWATLQTIENPVSISKTWLVVTSAVFGISLLIGTLIYLIYSSKRNNLA